MIEADMPRVLKNIQKFILENFNLNLRNLEQEAESSAYCACRFTLNDRVVIFRKAKITPAKNGQFVTCWKRNGEGITQPFESSDDFEFLMIAVESGNRSGVFIFPKKVHEAQKIIMNEVSGGKRGIRVYPSWDTTASRQADKTQKWQLEHFFETTIGKSVTVSERDVFS